MTQAAQIFMAEPLALELVRDRIRVNVVPEASRPRKCLTRHRNAT